MKQQLLIKQQQQQQLIKDRALEASTSITKKKKNRPPLFRRNARKLHPFIRRACARRTARVRRGGHTTREAATAAEEPEVTMRHHILSRRDWRGRGGRRVTGGLALWVCSAEVDEKVENSTFTPLPCSADDGSGAAAAASFK